MPHPDRPPSLLACRLQFLLCFAAGLALGWYALVRWPPFDDFRYAGDVRSTPVLATLDYGAAAVLFLGGPLRLGGWRRGRLTRPETSAGLLVTAALSLMAGAVYVLLFIGALKGVLSLPPAP